MADNRSIRDADNVEFDAATDELADLSHAPKTQQLDGSTSGIPISPATSGKQDTGNNSLSSIDTRTGSVTETAPASDTASSGLNGRLQRIAQRITSLIALLPSSLGTKTKATALGVTLASDEGHRAIARPFASVQRPANTNVYNIGDAWGTAASVLFTFTGAALAAGGKGVVRGAYLIKTTTTVANAVFKLHLFQNTPASAGALVDADPQAYLFFSDRAIYVGSITFSAGVAGSNGSLHEMASMSRSELFFDNVSTADLYGLVEVTQAYAPGNAETMFICLDVEQGR